MPHCHTPGRARPSPPLVSAQLGRHLISSPLPSMQGASRASAGPGVSVRGNAEGKWGPSTTRNQRERSVRTEERDLRRNLHQGTHRHVVVGRSSPPERSVNGNPALYIRRPAGCDAWAFAAMLGRSVSHGLSAVGRGGRSHFRKVSKWLSWHGCGAMLRVSLLS